MEKELKTTTIALLGGTGKEGPGLAMRWAVAGYPIIIGSRELDKAKRVASELREELGVDHISGEVNQDAARMADISVLTVVFTAHGSAVKSLKEALQGKILVDATARVNFRDPMPPKQPAAAVIAQEILGEDVTVVAAFQNAPAHSLKKNLDQPISTDVLVCADDLDAAEKVIELAEDGYMRAYYAGKLVDAIVVEGITSLLIHINKHYKTKTASIQITGL